MEPALCLHEIHIVQAAYGALASFSIRRQRRPQQSTLLPVESRLVSPPGCQRRARVRSASLRHLVETMLVSPIRYLHKFALAQTAC